MKYYFTNCFTKEEVVKQFRKLCFIHHPDKGGDNKDMIELLKQYKNKVDNISDDYNANHYNDAYKTFKFIRIISLTKKAYLIVRANRSLFDQAIWVPMSQINSISKDTISVTKWWYYKYYL